MNIEVFIIKIYIMRNRLTERDLSRIVSRVVNEDSGLAMSDPCTKKVMKLRSDPTYKRLLVKMKEYESLEWWEWYDKLNLAPTMEETQLYIDFIGKEARIRMECEPKPKKSPFGSY